MKVFDIEEYFKDKFDKSVRPTKIYYWEQKGLLGKINRDNNNRRVYTDEDVKKAVVLWMLKEVNISVRDARKIVIDKNERAREQLGNKLLMLEKTIIPSLKNYLTNNK